MATHAMWKSYCFNRLFIFQVFIPVVLLISGLAGGEKYIDENDIENVIKKETLTTAAV